MKPEHLAPPPCPFCNLNVQLKPTVVRHRRGDRILPIETWTWECISGCRDPEDPSAPFRFSDLPLMEWAEKEASQAWLTHFGEKMPPSSRPRLPRLQRTVRIPLLLTVEEAQKIDSQRGLLSRNEYIRRALKAS